MKSAKFITLALAFTLTLMPTLSFADVADDDASTESSLSPEEEWENSGPSTVIYENPGNAVHIELADNGEIINWYHSPEDDQDAGITPYATKPPATLPSFGFLDAFCLTVRPSYVMRQYESTKDGRVVLRCGIEKSYGYNHIRAKHQGHWTGQMGGAGVWRDFMHWSTSQALRYPGYVAEKGDQKRCYSTKVIVTKTSGKKKTFHATVLVSMNNKQVITSYPPNDQRC